MTPEQWLAREFFPVVASLAPTTVTASGVPTQGRLSSGHTGEDWHRLDIQWNVAVPEDCRQLVLTGTGADGVAHRVEIAVPALPG